MKSVIYDANFSRLPLICPIDDTLLHNGANGLECDNGHNFDVSRFGYANLLPVSLKRSKHPGDSKPMVESRRIVFDSGTYAPVRNSLMAWFREYLLDELLGEVFIVDTSCGEGYFGNAVSDIIKECSTFSRGHKYFGIDVSKYAVEFAAKRYKEIAWAVATNRRLPIKRGSSQLLMSVFGFESWLHWSVMQQPGQCALVVRPGPKHLKELKEVLYEENRPYSYLSEQLPLQHGYSLKSVDVRTSVVHSVSPDIIQRILLMTPHGYRARPGAIQESLAISELTLDIRLLLYCRK